jgi:predicted adenine nucleotide alpha hydrolase (AANH) superfamily ATPase
LAIEVTANICRKKHLKYFTTTLLCSPYKDHDAIIEIASEKAASHHLEFYDQDFRKGYWMGRNYARNHHIYVSGFCGCKESLVERRLE